MRVKKIFAYGMVAVMCAGMMTGCGKNDTKTQFKTYSKCATVDKAAYTDIEYVPESREVSQDEVDSAIDSFCSDNSEITQDKTSAIKDGDKVNVDYVETISGTEKDSQTAYDITIGSNTLGDGSDDQLIGSKPGDKKTVTVSYPDDYSDTTVAGLTAEFEVTINYISVTIVPEYTDDLVKKASDGEYTNTTDYTAHLKEDLQAEKDKSADKADREAVLKAVEEKVTFDKYPEDEIQSSVQSLVSNIRSAAENYGTDFETYAKYLMGYQDEASFLEYLHTTVESVMKEKIVVSCIALDNDLLADDSDIADYRKTLMEENNLENDSDIDQYYSADDIMFFATEENVLDFLMDRAVQTEATATDAENTDEETEAASEGSTAETTVASEDSTAETTEAASEDSTDEAAAADTTSSSEAE